MAPVVVLAADRHVVRIRRSALDPGRRGPGARRLAIRVGRQDLRGEGRRRGKEDEELSPEQLALRAYAQCIKLLGARDHSSAELTRKLAQRDFDEAAIASALAELREANYLDDDRYARTFAAQLVERGRGPMAIRAKLRERGIDGDLASDAVETLGADWVDRAQITLEGRFAPAAIADDEPKARARIARFLQSRGFGSADSLRALDRARKRIERESVADADPAED